MAWDSPGSHWGPYSQTYFTYPPPRMYVAVKFFRLSCTIFFGQLLCNETNEEIPNMQWTPDTALALLNEWRCSTLSKPEFLAMKGLPAHALKYAQRIVSGYDVPTHHPRVVTLTYTYEQFREMADTEDVNVLSRVAGFLAWRDIIPLNDPRIQSLCLFLPDKVNVAECIRILSKFPVSVNEFDRAERRNYPSTFNLSRPARRPTDAKLPRAAVIFNR